MDTGQAAFIGVIVGGLITGGVTLLSQILRGRQEANLDGAKRRDDRRLALNRFQVEALIGIQDQVLALRKSASYLARHPEAVVEPIGDDHYKSMLLVRTYRSRLDDENIGTLTANLIGVAGRVDDEEAMTQMKSIEYELLEATGKLLRETLER